MNKKIVYCAKSFLIFASLLLASTYIYASFKYCNAYQEEDMNYISKHDNSQEISFENCQGIQDINSIDFIQCIDEAMN